MSLHKGGIRINAKKSMTLRMNPLCYEPIVLDGIEIPDINAFRYLGSMVTDNDDINAEVSAKISAAWGSGDASLTVLEFLKVRITGSGDVFYKGTPELDIDITGSGDIVDAN